MANRKLTPAGFLYIRPQAEVINAGWNLDGLLPYFPKAENNERGCTC
jgi:hypothetical protein